MRTYVVVHVRQDVESDIQYVCQFLVIVNLTVSKFNPIANCEQKAWHI